MNRSNEQTVAHLNADQGSSTIKTPDISVIIVNWNSKDYLRACLQSLAKHPPAKLAYEVIVVDGGSFDGCGEMLAQEFPQVIFVQSLHNIGFARANNLGAQQARGEVVWLLNPDTEVRGDAAARLFIALLSSKDIGLVGPRLLNTDGSLQTSCIQSLPTPLNQALDSEILRKIYPHSRLWGTKGLDSLEEPVFVEAIPGACIMLRRQDFVDIGGFDPGYFMYGEDMDLCLRIQKRGQQILYVPAAAVVHHGGGSSRNHVSKFSAVHMRVAVVYYLRTHFGVPSVLLYRLLMTISATLRLMALLMSGLLSRDEESRLRNSSSRKKWAAILSWCLGGERWVYARPGGK